MIKTSKELIIDYFKKEKAKGVNELDTTTISNALNIQRSNVSSLLNQLAAEGRVNKTNTRPVYYSLPGEIGDQDAFSKMVGCDKSLSNAIQLAKAAILYPAKSLNTLITGSSGTGKSTLAGIMFEYAKRMGRSVPMLNSLKSIAGILSTIPRNSLNHCLAIPVIWEV